MQKEKFFPYSWHIDEDEKEVTSIRIYGLSDKNKNICVRVDNFTPYVYVELPPNVNWKTNLSLVQRVCDKIDIEMGEERPLSKKLMYKRRLYYAHIDIRTGKRKKFPYLFLSFSHHNDIRKLTFVLRKNFNILGLGSIKLRVHEQDASPILQLSCLAKIDMTGWTSFVGKLVKEEDKMTRCDYEYKVSWKSFKNCELNSLGNPLIMGFDIEVNSSNPSAMPNADKPQDKIFQISCCLFRNGESEESVEKYLLTLGNPDSK